MNDRIRLVLLSFLMLFTELALIRWAGSNVVYLGFFSNFVLLGSFLGIGVGFMRARATTDLFNWAPLALAFLVGFVAAFHVELDRSGSDLIFFGPLTPTGLPIWLMLPVVFAAVAGLFVMIGEGVAKTFVKFPALEAYRLDIGGSVLGIGGFTALAFVGAPPVIWGAVVGALMLLLVQSGWRVLQIAAVVGIVVVLGRESTLPYNSWSPYYKVSIAGDPVVEDAYHLSVNGIPHQSMATLPVWRATDPVYWVPYERSTGSEVGDVLVVGAGSGTDVAIALAEGARHVDAVEIDPRLQELGAELHPERPYDDRRVAVHIDDGRAFLERTDSHYDLILFALPDSLTLVAGQSSLRLESYLFTREALTAAKEHLNPNGVFAMYNLYREQWLIDRLAGTVLDVFGHAPCLDTVGDIGRMAVITVGRIPEAVQCGDIWAAGADTPAPVTDNYPFLYLRESGIPPLYLTTIALILIASIGLVRLTGVRARQATGYLDLFFMGAAFLLLETKSIVQFALLFGTTWVVNSLVFGGVLISVLLAIELARRIKLPSPAVLYAILLAAVAAGWFIEPHTLLPLPFWARFAAAIVVYFGPIFVANLVFAQRFKSVSSSNVAFGANLLGAMVGGLIEYAALITGYQTLALLVAVLYGLAFAISESRLALRRRSLASSPAA